MKVIVSKYIKAALALHTPVDIIVHDCSDENTKEEVLAYMKKIEEYDSGIKPHVDDVYVSKVSRGITFTIRGRISEEDAKELQMLKGFHPNGYGFYDHSTTATHTTWKCYNSCD